MAGIGTEIGKTVASAVLTEALQADYWKPVQSGELDKSDTMTIRQLVSNRTTVFHPEAYRLTQPLSPHAAAALDGVQITLDNLGVPQTANALVIELAGGLMVPLNSHDLNIDFVKQLTLPVVLVSRNYLGSINHTLLSVEACRTRSILIIGILFMGDSVPATEDFILSYTGLPCVGRIKQEPTLSKEVIKQYATMLSPRLRQLIEPL